MSQENLELLALAIIAGAVIVSVALVHFARQRLLAASIRERERVLQSIAARMPDADEFVRFASSPDAQRLFQSFDHGAAIGRRLLAMTASAILVGSAGIGFLINSVGAAPGDDLNIVREAQSARWWGLLFLAVAFGLAAASAVCGRLARRWGLLDQ